MWFDITGRGIIEPTDRLQLVIDPNAKISRDDLIFEIGDDRHAAGTRVGIRRDATKQIRAPDRPGSDRGHRIP